MSTRGRRWEPWRKPSSPPSPLTNPLISNDDLQSSLSGFTRIISRNSFKCLSTLHVAKKSKKYFLSLSLSFFSVVEYNIFFHPSFHFIYSFSQAKEKEYFPEVLFTLKQKKRKKKKRREKRKRGKGCGRRQPRENFEFKWYERRRKVLRAATNRPAGWLV